MNLEQTAQGTTPGPAPGSGFSPELLAYIAKRKEIQARYDALIKDLENRASAELREARLEWAAALRSRRDPAE
jgi:hypothetical protein